MLVCEEINFELPPKIIVLNPKDGFTVIKLPPWYLPAKSGSCSLKLIIASAFVKIKETKKGLRHFLWYGRMIEENAGCAWHALGCFTERNPKDEYTDKKRQSD